MIKRLQQSEVGRRVAQPLLWAQQLLVPSFLRRRVFTLALVANVLAGFYWGLIASDRYISEAHVVVQRTDMAGGQSMDFSSVLSGLSNNDHADQRLLRDYLSSLEMLRKLDESLALRKHYSDTRHDFLSRLGGHQETIEEFHRYFRSRVSIEFDEYAGVLVIRAQAFDPQTAQAIARALVEEGERKLNAMGHSLAAEQVRFLEQQVEEMNARVLAARQAVLEYQNEKGLISPQGEAETRASITANFEGQLAQLQAQRSTMLAYLVADSPKIRELDAQIAAIKQQIAQERTRLAGPSGQALNSTVEEYQRLVMAAEFAGNVYKTALTALERGRVEAMRMLKKVSVLQNPTLAEYSLEPRRLYNFIVFMLVSLLLTGIVHLIAAIIRDHKD